MVEVLEYLLVFSVTVLLAGFSLIVFGGLLPNVASSQGQTEVEQLAGSAALAAAEGNSSVVLPMADATVSCAHGVVYLSQGNREYSSSSIGAACSFKLSDLDGMCRMVFTRGQRGVDMEAAC